MSHHFEIFTDFDLYVYVLSKLCLHTGKHVSSQLKRVLLKIEKEMWLDQLFWLQILYLFSVA